MFEYPVGAAKGRLYIYIAFLFWERYKSKDFFPEKKTKYTVLDKYVYDKRHRENLKMRN